MPTKPKTSKSKSSFLITIKSVQIVERPISEFPPTNEGISFTPDTNFLWSLPVVLNLPQAIASKG